MQTVTLGNLSLSLLLLASSTGCATTTFESRVVESPASSRLVRGEGAPVQGSFHHEEGAIVGTVSWSNACKGEEVREVKTQLVQVTKRSRPAGVLMVVTGIAGLVAGGYLLSTAGDGRHADYRSCNDSSDDDCKSPRERLTEAGITALLMGASLGGVGTWSLAAGPGKTDVGEPTTHQRTEVVTPAAACGRGEELTGLSLGTFLQDGSPVLGSVDSSGAVRISLPPASALEGETVAVRIVTVPEALRDRLSPGMVVDQVVIPRPAPARRAGARRASR